MDDTRYFGPQYDAATGPREVVARLGELQRAAAITGLALAREWAGLGADYGGMLSRSLLDAARKCASTGDAVAHAPAELAGEVLQEYRNYLGGLAQLPRVYGLMFLAELERARASRRQPLPVTSRGI